MIWTERRKEIKRVKESAWKHKKHILQTGSLFFPNSC
ncbi:hypothetical protein QF042_004444 [Pedobacter sp. W3I1]|nr:hypothetical protein [Pedobacter sp. W3I1]